MLTRHAVALLGSLLLTQAAAAQDFRIDDVGAGTRPNAAQLKPGVIAFGDQWGVDASPAGAQLIRFDDWAAKHPAQKNFLALYPTYVEPTIQKTASGVPGPIVEKLYMYVAEASFVVDRAPGAIDLSRYVTVAFVERIDPAIKHTPLAVA